MSWFTFSVIYFSQIGKVTQLESNICIYWIEIWFKIKNRFNEAPKYSQPYSFSQIYSFKLPVCVHCLMSCCWSRLYCLLFFSLLPELTRLHETLQQHCRDRVNVGKSRFIHKIHNLNIHKKRKLYWFTVNHFHLQNNTRDRHGYAQLVSLHSKLLCTKIEFHTKVHFNIFTLSP